MTENDQRIQQWIEYKRHTDVPDGFADRVMASISGQQADDVQRQLLARLLVWVVASRPGRFAACLVAFLLGMTPFLYLVLIGISTAAGLTL